MLASAVCDCGFRSVDTLVIGDGEPVRYSLRVESQEDLSARVIRSSVGTMEIPEFGISVDPGPMCEAFISNVEGVLMRFDHVLDTLLLSAKEDEKDKILSLKTKIADAREVKEPFTLIIQDFDGNSAIVSKKTVKSAPVQPEENPES